MIPAPKLTKEVLEQMKKLAQELEQERASPARKNKHNDSRTQAKHVAHAISLGLNENKK
jgi:hypothetical protein